MKSTNTKVNFLLLLAFICSVSQGRITSVDQVTEAQRNQFKSPSLEDIRRIALVKEANSRVYRLQKIMPRIVTDEESVELGEDLTQFYSKRLFPIVGKKEASTGENWDDAKTVTTANSSTTTPENITTTTEKNITDATDATAEANGTTEGKVVEENNTISNETANQTSGNVTIDIEYQPFADGKTNCSNGTNLTCENEIPLVNPADGTARPGEPEECTHPDTMDINQTKKCLEIDPYMKSDEVFTMINALIQGFRYMDSLPSMLKCSENIHLSVNTFIRNEIEWKNYTKSEWGLIIFDVTRWISYTLAPSTRYCYMVGLEGWRWVRVKGELFPKGFDSWFPAWLQSLLGDVMTVNAIRIKLEKANQEIPPDKIAAFYWYGRLVDIAINFKPIDMDEEQLQALDSWEENRANEVIGKKLFSKNLARRSLINYPIVGQEEGKNSTENQTEESKKPFNQVWAFTIGLVNSSFGSESPNVEVCHSNVSRLVNHSIDFIDDVIMATNESLNMSATDFENVLEAIYPITYSCYHTIFDIKDATMVYLNSFSSWQRVLFNLMHKVGLIFDTVWWVVKHHQNFTELTSTEHDRDVWWYKCGSYYGMIFRQLFYSEHEPNPIDPADDLEWTSGFKTEIIIGPH